MRTYMSKSERNQTSLVSLVHPITLLGTVVRSNLVHSP